MPTAQTPWGPGFLPEAGLLSCTRPQLRLESPGPRLWNSQSLSPVPSGPLHLAFCTILKLSLSKVKYIVSPNPHFLLYLPAQLRTPRPLPLENLKPFYTLLHDPQPDPPAHTSLTCRIPVPSAVPRLSRWKAVRVQLSSGLPQ